MPVRPGAAMPRYLERLGEVPPTAGLPLLRADLGWPTRHADADLGAALARFLRVEAAQIECSGTAALVVALTALSRLVPERDEVVVPGYTCPLVALAVIHCGLKLRVCDLGAGTLDLDPAHLQRLCNAQTLAVLPTHLGGRIADVATALDCARRVGAWTIEDAAQALGAQAEGRSVGTRGDIGFFSLAVGKGLSMFEGGALVVGDPALREACAQASVDVVPPRAGWELRRSLELLGYALCYRPAVLRWVYGLPLRRALRRGDWLGAAGDVFEPTIPLHRVGRWRQAVGVRALARLPGFLAQCTAQARRRRNRLADIPGVQVLEDSAAVPCAAGVWPVFLIRLPTRAHRDSVLRAAWGNGCGLSLPFAHALPDYPCLASAMAPQVLPHARTMAARLLAISNSPWLDDARFAVLCDTLAEHCASAPRTPMSPGRHS
ncbi:MULTISPECIES: DegT/DnrJ/EryC1/StrS family aminotransferase [unclassified Variovorax]|uniref:DegT/DnrJ/EryC1/StrS family aminotransferase n=1 Tax=unclassified Variovorax TaxID=663243 RepID=UPI003F449697